MINSTLTRRELLYATGAAGLAASAPGFAATEPPPETTRLRLIKLRSICVAPQYVAEELFRAEGFTDIRYIDPGTVGASGVPAARALGAGTVDINVNFAAPLVIALDEGSPITVGDYNGWTMLGNMLSYAIGPELCRCTGRPRSASTRSPA